MADDPAGRHPGLHLHRPEPRPRYGLVLITIILAILVIAFAPDTTFTRFLSTVIVGAALLLALRSAQASPRLVRQATAILGLAAIGALGAAVTGRNTNEFSTTLTLILVGLTPVVLATRLVRNPEVNAQSLIGAACVYLLMGLFFALIFSLVPFVTGAQVLYLNLERKQLRLRLLQLHHHRHGRLRRSGPRHHAWPHARRHRGADGPAVPGDGGGAARQQLPPALPKRTKRTK